MDPGIVFLLVLAIALVGSWFLASQAWARILLAVGRRTAGLRTHSIDVGESRWHFLEGGRGPLLLALHGFGGDCDNWLRAAPALGRHFRMVVPDLPGFGESNAPDDLGFDIPTQLERLRAFTGRLGEQPVFLAGNSMGGWIASAYALEYPEHIRALWLLAPLGVADAPSSPPLDAIRDGEASPLEISSPDQFHRRIFQPMFGRAPWLPFPLRDFYAQRGIESSTTAAGRFRQVIGSPLSLEQIVTGLKLPVHLQWGSLDRAVNPEGVHALQRVMPGMDVHVLDGIGHLPMLEAPGSSVGHWIAFCRDRGLLESR